ncbi:exo-beta-1,3-glucanase [Methylicorpusculum sp.]|uniref:glycoside hydrolase family 17 protein n=1 Tax=Methylicorpusculum sp. TaxID=2713644 RepID=UPI00272FBC4C|nr:exo-beta-1,3-glucanase [Methylicorpusculum sp.]MDP2180598.1 exo-beta-1,3-glucanase [Methylicorpusculum sp.]MDP3528865.1 exo-beta-1,3-glucanase [Methylicorpusculum sp.]MDZ4151944.1 exo-beta-1,3-glucanase [Methylicorpusculum sp.]
MRFIVIAVLVILSNISISWLFNQPQDVGEDVPEGKLNSLSFAPFREGQSPLEEKFATEAQIDEDLRLLADKTHTIRTYSSAENMFVTPKLAGKYGLNMIQGAWLGYGKKDNNEEIEALIDAANTYPDVIKRVIVGNEVLLRGDLKPEQVLEYIRRVKQAVKQPVSYADVWSMYLKHPELIKEVDFITIHILPYWEDEPIPVEEAPGHIDRIYKQVRAEADEIAPGKPILIGESGWPGKGRQRGSAVPSIVNEAMFIRGLIKVATENGFDYNIVEAFNQPWKSNLEGVVGANWGLYSSERKEVFPLTGPVYENDDWYERCIFSSLFLLMAAFAFRKQLLTLDWQIVLGYLVFAQILGVLLIVQIDELFYTSYSHWQRFITLAGALFNAALSGLILFKLINQLTQNVIHPKLGNWLYRIFFVFGAFALYKTMGLAINGRYISFPVELAAIPVISLIALIFAHFWSSKQLSIKSLSIENLIGTDINRINNDTWLGYALLVMAPILVFGESYAFFVARDLIQAYPGTAERIRVALSFALGNQQLVMWLVCLLIIALPFLYPLNSTKEEIDQP